MKRFGLSAARIGARLIVPVSAVVFTGIMAFSMAIILTYHAQPPIAEKTSLATPGAIASRQ